MCVSIWRDLLRFSGFAALFVALPSFAVGFGYPTTLSTSVFALLALTVPIAILRAKRFANEYAFPWKERWYAYSWLWWMTLFGVDDVAISVSLPLPRDIAVPVIWLVSMLLCLCLVIMTGAALAKYFTRTKDKDLVNSVADIAIVAFPIPLAFFGNLAYTNFSLPGVADAMIGFAYGLMTQAVYALCLVTVLTISVYFYVDETRMRTERIAIVSVSSLVWLAINGHVLIDGYIPEMLLPFISAALPLFRESPLVFVTPAVFEVAVLTVSVVCGFAAARLFRGRVNKEVR